MEPNGSGHAEALRTPARAAACPTLGSAGPAVWITSCLCWHELGLPPEAGDTPFPSSPNRTPSLELVPCGWQLRTGMLAVRQGARQSYWPPGGGIQPLNHLIQTVRLEDLWLFGIWRGAQAVFETSFPQPQPGKHYGTAQTAAGNSKTQAATEKQ